MTHQSIFGERVVVRYPDLVRVGYVSSRYDLHQKIKAGILRPPNKGGDSQQSAAWWWAVDVEEDIERHREATRLPQETAA